MGNLAIDTAVERNGDGYRGMVSPEWAIWGANGGYVASIALRAALAESPFARAASITCHFLNGAAFDAVELQVRELRRAKRAQSLQVSMTQGEKPILQALVWVIDDVDGLEHDHARMPDVAPADELTRMEELTDDPRSERFAFFANFDERPTDWIPDRKERPPGEPRATSWFRFLPATTFADPAVDACRSLILLDTMEWPAAVRAHTGDVPWMAPSLDLSARFHRFEPESEWLLSDSTASVAADGMIGGAASVWSAGGRLLATGAEQMLCRPAPTG